VKKTLLVSAVAMAISGNAVAAEMYGNIRLGLQTADGSVGGDELDVVSGKLVLGSKGSSDLGNGMTISYGVELEHDKADVKSGASSVAIDGVTTTDTTVSDTISFQTSSGWANDKSWVGLSGGFGSVKVGRAGDLAGYVCGGTDLLTIGTAEACSLGHNTEFDNAIMYTGGAGAFEFGAVFTADGSAADDDTSIGAKFSGESWSVGFVTWEDESGNGGLGATKTQIGGTLQLGNIGLGVTVGDNDATTDSGGTDLGLYMPLGAGNLAVVFSTLDTTKALGTKSNGDSTDVEYSASLGDSGYWGLTWNSKDNWDDDRITGWIGTNF